MSIEKIYLSEAKIIRERLQVLKERDKVKYYEIRSDMIKELGEDFYYQYIGMD